MLPVSVNEKLPHEAMKPLALRPSGPKLAERSAPMYQASSPSSPPTKITRLPLSVTTRRIETDPESASWKDVVGPRVSIVNVPDTSRSNTDSRFASMLTLASRKNPAEESSAIARAFTIRETEGFGPSWKSRSAMSSNSLPEIAIAPNRLALANPSSVSSPSTTATTYGPAAFSLGVPPLPSSQLIVASSGPVPETRFGTAPLIVTQRSSPAGPPGQATRRSRRSSASGPGFATPSTVSSPSSVRYSKSLSGSRSVMSAPELLKITRA